MRSVGLSINKNDNKKNTQTQTMTKNKDLCETGLRSVGLSALWDWFEISGFICSVRLVWDQWVYLLCETGLRSVGLSALWDWFEISGFICSVRLVWDQWVYLLCDSSSCSTTAVAQVLGVNLVDLGSFGKHFSLFFHDLTTPRSEFVCEGIAWYRWWPAQSRACLPPRQLRNSL